MAALGGLREHANEMPHTLKIGMRLGAYYAKAQNLRRRLRQAYDDALDGRDLLLMPTTQFPRCRLRGRRERAGGDPAQLDHSGQHQCVRSHRPPAISGPCGETDGKRVALMPIGRHFARWCCARPPVTSGCTPAERAASGQVLAIARTVPSTTEDWGSAVCGARFTSKLKTSGRL